MATPLIILGAIGNCLDILDAALATNASEDRPVYDLLGFLDDEPSRQGSKVRGLPILGPLTMAREMPNAQFINGIGSPRSFQYKRAIIDGLGLDRSRFATVIHPAAAVSPSANIGCGTAVLANCTICANAELGDHVMMLPSCVLGHDARVGDHTILAAGVIVSGSVSIGQSCYLGANSCVRDSLRVGDEALLGIGAVLVDDAPAGMVMLGNPARKIKIKSRE